MCSKMDTRLLRSLWIWGCGDEKVVQAVPAAVAGAGADAAAAFFSASDCDSFFSRRLST